MRYYIRKALKFAFLVQLLVDETISGLESMFIFFLLPIAWLVHPMELTLSAARHVQRSVTIFDFLLVSSTMNEIWVYVTWLLSRYERMNMEVNRLELEFRRRVTMMQSIQKDYQHEPNDLLHQFSFPKGVTTLTPKRKVIKKHKLRPLRVGPFTKRTGIQIPNSQLEKLTLENLKIHNSNWLQKTATFDVF